jgi:hypothetical protein
MRGVDLESYNPPEMLSRGMTIGAMSGIGAAGAEDESLGLEATEYSCDSIQSIVMSDAALDCDLSVDTIQAEASRQREVKKDVAVGAGAIDQKLTVDNRPLDEYHQDAKATMRIYFVFEDELKNYIHKGGIHEHAQVAGGSLAGVPVG